MRTGTRTEKRCVYLNVNGDHQSHHITLDDQLLLYDDDSITVDVQLTPWDAERLLLDLLVLLPKIRNDKG